MGLIDWIISVMNDMYNKMKNIYNMFCESVQEVFSGKKITAEYELEMIKKSKNDEIIVFTPAASRTLGQNIVNGIVQTIKDFNDIKCFINGCTDYFIRIIKDRSYKSNVKKYIRMDRQKRLTKMNELLLKEAMFVADINVEKEVIKYLSKSLIQLYEDKLEDLPDFKIMNKLKEKLTKEIIECKILKCDNLRCHDIHIAFRTSNKFKINIFRFGQCTNLDLNTYVSERNFAKIAVISQLEMAHMYATKSITIVDYKEHKILLHKDLTLLDQPICPGLMLGIHNQLVTQKYDFLRLGSNIKMLKTSNEKIEPKKDDKENEIKSETQNTSIAIDDNNDKIKILDITDSKEQEV